MRRVHKVIIALMIIGLLIIGGCLHRSRVQHAFSHYSVEKRVITDTASINIAPTPVSLLHYQQRLVKKEIWSMLTVDSPKSQKINSDVFKLYRGTGETPDIYFEEDIKVNAQSTRALKKGVNRILMKGTYTDPRNLKLVILNKQGLSYQQDWLQSDF